MPTGTEREVLELLLERPRSPTQVAEELDVSVQTASRNLKKLVDEGLAERQRGDSGGGRGYKRYRAREFARLLAGYDGELFEATLDLSAGKRAVLSVWKVPQEEFHPVLLSYLFAGDGARTELDVVGIVVYGSVARGDARPDSDVDILLVYDDGSRAEEYVDTTFGTDGSLVDPNAKRVISETWFTRREFEGAAGADSQFLRNALGDGIVLYDPEGVIRDARRRAASEGVPG